jgi:3-methyladenine DNA glycosylase AlkD
MDIQLEEASLLREIQGRADAHYESVIRRSIPSSLDVYGLRIFEIRKIVRDWRRKHTDVNLADLLTLVEALWSGTSREERLVALELLKHYPDSILQLTWTQFDRWRRDLDSWELTDILGLSVLGVWVASRPDLREQHLCDLLADEDVWSRRLGLVAGIGLNRALQNVESATLVLEMVDEEKDDRHPMITKAVSWTLRSLGTRHPDAVLAYLEANEQLLAAHVVREVTNKLTTGRKDGRPSTSSGRRTTGRT